MPKRAVVCVGVNRPQGMTPLTAAAADAEKFHLWALGQGCDSELLSDDSQAVRLGDVYAAVNRAVQQRIYDQIIVYFSGHGILKAPGSEYWLLTDSPGNPNEAVNLVSSIEAARDSGIPHVVFVSDACRSAADTHQLRAIHGGLIFPPLAPAAPRSEIDACYATLPGDPANEVSQVDATAAFKGLFTDCLLEVITQPPSTMVETTTFNGVTISVISTRTLKTYLETTVPVKASAVNITLNQQPDVQVGTALPKYFAEVPPGAAVSVPAEGGGPDLPPPGDGGPQIASPGALLSAAWEALGLDAYSVTASAIDLLSPRYPIAAVAAEIVRIMSAKGRERFETRTGFSVHGAHVTAVTSQLRSDPPFAEATESPTGAIADHIRFYENNLNIARSCLLTLDTGNTVLLPVCQGMIGTVLVEDGRVVSINYLPSAQSPRFQEYESNAEQVELMKAYAALASRAGRFQVPDESAQRFAARIRQFKGLDPMMGIYAAYGYAQIGRQDDVLSVCRYMRDDELPLPFDVAMLAWRQDPTMIKEYETRIAPFGPLLSQGWAHLHDGHPLAQPIHARLTPYMIPGLFTTFDSAGAAIAVAAIASGEVR